MILYQGLCIEHELRDWKLSMPGLENESGEFRCSSVVYKNTDYKVQKEAIYLLYQLTLCLISYMHTVQKITKYTMILFDKDLFINLNKEPH